MYIYTIKLQECHSEVHFGLQLKVGFRHEKQYTISNEGTSVLLCCICEVLILMVILTGICIKMKCDSFATLELVG